MKFYPPAVVAEVTQTSMGVGFELGRAVAWEQEDSMSL